MAIRFWSSMPSSLAQPLDLVALSAEIGVRLRDSLELEVAAEPLHLVEVDAHALPEQHAAPL